MKLLFWPDMYPSKLFTESFQISMGTEIAAYFFMISASPVQFWFCVSLCVSAHWRFWRYGHHLELWPHYAPVSSFHISFNTKGLVLPSQHCMLVSAVSLEISTCVFVHFHCLDHSSISPTNTRLSPGSSDLYQSVISPVRKRWLSLGSLHIYTQFTHLPAHSSGEQ